MGIIEGRAAAAVQERKPRTLREAGTTGPIAGDATRVDGTVAIELEGEANTLVEASPELKGVAADLLTTVATTLEPETTNVVGVAITSCAKLRTELRQEKRGVTSCKEAQNESLWCC